MSKWEEAKDRSVQAVIAVVESLYKERGAAWLVDETGVPRSTVDRIGKPGDHDKGFNTGNWSRLMKLPECRVAAIQALQGEQSKDSVWSLLGAEMGRDISIENGWRVLHALQALANRDRLVEGISALEGYVKGLKAADQAELESRKGKRDKGKQES